MAHQSGVHADAGVDHIEAKRQPAFIAGGCRRYTDRHFASFGEFHCIANQVGKHLTQAKGIAANPGRDVVFDQVTELQSLLLRLSGE